MSSSGTGISSRVWTESMEDISWSQQKKEDEEEALQWAALEKLPTYNRLKRGLLAEVGEAPKEIDVQHLSFHETKQVLNRLVNTTAEDNERFLMKLRARIDRVGIDIPTIEVQYKDLRIKAKARVGGRALPSVFNSIINGMEALLNILHILPSCERQISILHDISGVIKPGRMTLLLGPPASGKTTLLLALAGRLGKDLKVSGKVTYNGHEMDEFVPQRTSAYISQTDLHIPEMTVRETLAFSARCQGVRTNYDMLVELLRREKEAKIKPDMDIDIYMKAASMKGQEASIVTEYILKILGLEHSANTMVGNAMKRGISGGEKKRLTTGEMLVGQVKAFFMDEISTGLDTSTTFQIVKAIRQSVHILQGTSVISLLQPAPETYDLFDDIILLSDGHIVYQGPRENVLEFFEHMGFRCPKRKGVADFLQEVTSGKEQQQYWIHNDHEKCYKFVSINNFVEAFKSFHIGQKLKQELAVPFDKARSHPASLVTKSYGLNKKELLKACTARELLLMKRNSFVYVFKAADLCIVALIVMTLFFRTEMPKRTVTDGGMFMGVLFFTIMRLVFNGYAEMSMTVMELPVFFKQRDLLFFPAWAYSLPKWILRIPISVIQPIIWVSLTYYEIGFDSDVGRLLKQYLLLVWLQQMATGLFRFIAGLGRRIIVASTIGSCMSMTMMALGGFILSRENVKSWWIWGYWTSPLMYAQNAIVVNEFLGRSWRHVPPNSTESLGMLILKSRGIFPQAYWYWLGVGALFGFCLLFNFLFTLALTYLNPLGKPKAILPRESLNDDVDRDHKSTELSLRQRRSFETGDTITGNASSRSCSSSIDQTNLNRRRGLVLPFQPLTITFDEIRYAIDMPERMKGQGIIGDKLEILKGISGAFKPGILTALMGISGAGKTTLMDVLAGRKTDGFIDGTIKISGYPKKQETFAHISGYVEQADIHSPHLTVYESLLFSAWLRLPTEVASETREMFIEEVMDLVELTAIRDALVGMPGVDGLSTEQRKRLTISVELVANPSIIFMDEPTSGLDARAAAIVMRAVKNTVNTGRTVVCTIHQPSIDIFDAFDELLLMKHGGEEIYFGPLGRHACHLINYFEGIKGVAKIMDGHNPASWMLEITSVAQEAKIGVDFAETYKKSELYRRTKKMIKVLHTPAPGSKDLRFPSRYSQSFITQCLACLWKQHWSYWRNTQYNTVRLIFAGLSGLILGLIFWDLGSKREREQDLFNAMGSMYAAVLFLGIRNASTIQPIIDVERTVFYRERAAGMYSSLPYAFGQVVIELPYAFSQTIIYGIIIYTMMGYQQTTAKFFWYIYFTYFTLLSFTYYGMMMIAISPSVHISNIISSSFYSMWNLFSGFVVPQTRMPTWWRWYYWTAPTAWTLYGLVVSQYGDVKDMLNNGQTVEQFLRSHFGFRHDFLGVVATTMVIFPLVFAITFAFSIKSINFQRR